jgi:photosystem II stability/assembly factor-like uncharacterized protein
MELRRLWWVFLGALAWAAVPAHASLWVTQGPNQAISALAADPTTPGTIWAGGTGGGVYKSTDAGQSWTPFHNGIPNIAVRALAIDPTNPTTIYAGTSGSGVYKTTNGGMSWDPANLGLASNIRSLAIDPVFPSIVYAGSDGVGMYKTVLGGALWAQINVGFTGNTVTALAIDPSNTNRVYAATIGAGVFLTTTGGASWGNVNSGVFEDLPLQVLSLAMDPSDSSTVYAGTMTNGVYKTIVGFGNWNNINTGLTNLEVHALAIDPLRPTTVFAATAAGIFRRTDRYDSWTAMSGGLTTLDVGALAIDTSNPSDVYVASSAGTGVFVQTQLCSAQPLTACSMGTQAGKSVLTIKDKKNNKQDTLVWKWLKGEAVSVGDFGDPLTTDTYSLCIYDESVAPPLLLLGATAPAGGTCGKKPCWKVSGKTGFKYKDGQRTADGFDTITLKAGAAGKAQTVVTLKGISFAIPTLPLNLPVRAQLQAGNGNCFDTHFSTVRKNLVDQFDARAD